MCIRDRGYTEEEAYDLLYNSGLRVYTTCDVEMQDYLEKAFNVDTNSTIFPAVINEEYPEGAFVVLGLDGQIKAIAGSDRTKTCLLYTSSPMNRWWISTRPR